MKKLHSAHRWQLPSVAVFMLAGSLCFGVQVVDYVNPFIGTDAHGHVYPGATVPFGMVQLSPDTRDGSWDGSSGYHYSDTSIMGFSHNHLTGTGVGDLGTIMFMPTVGALKLDPGRNPASGYRARFSHTQETARPGYYEVWLPDYEVKVELTATAHAGFHRYTFPKTTEAHVIVDLQHGINNGPTDAQITIENDHTISGYRRSGGWVNKVYYFVAEFSRPFDAASVDLNDRDVTGKQATGRNIKGHFDFKTKKGGQILIRVGLSTVSVEGARKNLHAEIPNWNFDVVAKAASRQWEKALSVLTVESKDKNLEQTFYTALYHSMLAPTILNDVDGQFRGPDGNVHQTDGYNYYTEFSLWDIFRAEAPLLTLTQPQRVNDIVKTMLAHFKIFGNNTLPVWTESGKENWCMIGNHSIPIITAAYMKGFRDWNADEALDDMIASTDKYHEPSDASYSDKGFIPSRRGSQSVSKVLEYAYDDSCIARFAQMLGKNDIAAKYFARSKNWTNVFDVSTGFMRGKNADGSWIEPFNPDRIDVNDYTEANAWQYNFFVPQNVAGLIAKSGGDEKFVAKLDELFDSTNEIPNLIPDVTGLVGMYSQGDEPCHHVAYLYDYAGQPWKTQIRAREVAALYTNTPDGLCGNDDCGQMSAWYVLTALGFYPVDPASGIYVFGSPLIDKATLRLDSKFAKGRTFTITAKHNSAKNIYIQSVTLNGKPLTRCWISNKEITDGGKLVFTMGPTPDKSFGSAPADCPPGTLHDY